MVLNKIQRDIINHIVAENEGTHSFGKMEQYVQAFRGRFSPEMPFTFYFLSAVRPIMYVYDPRSAEKRSSRLVFHAECAQKKNAILEITSFYEYLTEQGYVRRCYKGLQGRQELPTHYGKVWRRYSDFYNDMVFGLSFVCLADFLPKLKLYKLWKNLDE